MDTDILLSIVIVSIGLIIGLMISNKLNQWYDKVLSTCNDVDYNTTKKEEIRK